MSVPRKMLKKHNSETIETLLNAFHVKKCSTLKTDKQQNIDNKYARETESKTVVDSLKNTCKSLKAAKQTKTLRQQNSHETLSKKRSSTTTGIIVDDDDDNDNSNNSNNKNNRNNNANSKRNNKRNSNKKNSIIHMRSADGDGGDYCCVGGEHNNEAIHMGETKTITEDVLKKINKSKKLMNEDQIDERVRYKEEDIHYYENPRNKETQEDISTSDSEGGHNPKLKEHLRRNNPSSFSNLSKPNLKLHDSCISTQRSSFNHFQCQIQPSARNSSKIMLSHRNSLFCLNTVKTKSRSTTNKRDQSFTPAPLVTPSSSSAHILDNREIEEQTKLDQIPSQRTNTWETMNSVELTENTETLEKGNASGHESYDYAETREHRTAVECDGDNEDTDNEVETSLGASYSKLCHKSCDSPVYDNDSSNNTSEDSSIERKLKYKESGDKIKPMLHLKSSKKNTRNTKTSNDQLLRQDNLRNQPTKKNESNTNTHIDEMIQERENFLKLCIKNRFYQNPNYAEPWKVFSSISERLLNDVLNSVENEFAVGVSKFVEDFLELETKT